MTVTGTVGSRGVEEAGRVPGLPDDVRLCGTSRLLWLELLVNGGNTVPSPLTFSDHFHSRIYSSGHNRPNYFNPDWIYRCRTPRYPCT